MSAMWASPADSGIVVVDKVPLDKVRALQHTLYRTAKADPGRRFHALWDKVLRRDVLWRGWVAVRRNFRYGHSAARFRTIEQHVHDRLAVFIGRRHKRGRGFGWSVLAYKSTDYCGLFSLNGTVIAPRC